MNLLETRFLKYVAELRTCPSPPRLPHDVLGDTCNHLICARQHEERDPHQRDVVLYIPDDLLVISHVGKQAWRMRYDFCFGNGSAAGILSTKGLLCWGNRGSCAPSWR